MHIYRTQPVVISDYGRRLCDMLPKPIQFHITNAMRVQEPCVELLPALLLHEDPWPSFESIPALNKNQRLSAAPPANYRRLTQREQLQALRQEVSALAQYFQQLSENQELQRSLDRLLNESTVSLINWRRAATRQRHARAKAEETKAELMRRIAVNVSFLENVKQLLMIQAHRIAERPSLCMPMRVMPIGLDNKDIQMFQALQSGLDYRCNRLDAILQQCVSRFGTTQKTHELFIHPNGRSVEVRQIDIQPFDAATISNTMQQYVEKQANVYWRKDNDVVSCPALRLMMRVLARSNIYTMLCI